MNFTTEKANLESQINRYVTLLSSLEQPPIDLIEEIQYFKGLVQFANPTELESLQGDWSEIGPKDTQSLDYIRGKRRPMAVSRNILKAILAFKAGARHTRPEDEAIQDIHDTMVEWGAKCEYPKPYKAELVEAKAGAKHSRADREIIQQIHDLSLDLGAKCPLPKLYPVWSEKLSARKALIYKANHSGAMVALFLPPEQARQHALPAGMGKETVPPGELHLTLAYLGEAENLARGQEIALHLGLTTLAHQYAALLGHINGVGRFCNGNEEGDPFFIIPDLPSLFDFRRELLTILDRAGIRPPAEHGFAPYITLGYFDHESPNPFDQVERAAIEFPTLSLVMGEDRYDYFFAGGEPYPEPQKSQHSHILRHLSGEHNQKTHGHGHSKAASIFQAELPENLTMLRKTQTNSIVKKLAKLSAGELRDAVQENDKLWTKARQDDNDKAIQEGWVKNGLLERAIKQRKKDLQKQLAKPRKGPDNNESKELDILNGLIVQSQTEAPNYRPTNWARRCENCRFFGGQDGPDDTCTRFDFVADLDYVCDDWQAQKPDEIPGFAGKSLAEMAAIIRRN